jgi:hypothetical protein
MAASMRRPNAVARELVGDVRSLPLLEAFHAWVELTRAPASMPPYELRRWIRQGVQREEELVIDPRFFRELGRQRPNVSTVDIQLKRGTYRNELNRFRYDVRGLPWTPSRSSRASRACSTRTSRSLRSSGLVGSRTRRSSFGL